MNQLYPIIRRIRRPLIEEEPPRVVVLETVPPTVTKNPLPPTESKRAKTTEDKTKLVVESEA